MKEEKLQEAKRLYESANADQKYVLESLFPELAGSEDEKTRKEIVDYLKKNLRLEWAAWLEKQGECHISHDDEIMIEQLTEYFTTGRGLQNTNETVVEWLNDIKEKIYNKSADKVEPKCEESKTKIFDAPTPFEDKLYAFVLACEILVDPSKREFILEHSQEILDAAREQIGKEQSSAWSKEDERLLNNMIIVIKDYYNDKDAQSLISWLKSLKDRTQPQNCIYYNPYKEVVESIAEMCKHYDKASHSGLRDFYDNVNVKCKDAKEYDSLFPQNTWKPSDEQMKVLISEVEGWTKGCPKQKVLESLYNDLKNLK